MESVNAFCNGVHKILKFQFFVFIYNMYIIYNISSSIFEMSMCCTIDRFKSYLDDESNELSNMKEAISYLSVYLFAKDDNELFEKVIKKHDDLKEKIA